MRTVAYYNEWEPYAAQWLRNLIKAGASGLAWLDHVCADLEGAGYAAAAANLCAAGAGAPHIRQRLYWAALSNTSIDRSICRAQISGDSKTQFRPQEFSGLVQDALAVSVPAGAHGALVDRVPGRVGRLRAYGNAIVPQAAAAFVKAFMDSRP